MNNENNNLEIKYFTVQDLIDYLTTIEDKSKYVCLGFNFNYANYFINSTVEEKDKVWICNYPSTGN